MVVSFGMIVYGTVLGYPTKTLPGLRNETDISIQLDEHMGSWYAALFWICGIVFAPLGGTLSGWLGRRKSILLTIPLVFTGKTFQQSMFITSLRVVFRADLIEPVNL